MKWIVLLKTNCKPISEKKNSFVYMGGSMKAALKQTAIRAVALNRECHPFQSKNIVPHLVECRKMILRQQP